MTITEGVRSGTENAGRIDFVSGPWQDSINLRDFIQRNYTPYLGDASFLAGATARTTGVWAKLSEMFPEERRKGVYDVDATTPSSITAHAPGYIDQANEVIVGLQTDAPLKRAIMPFGGWRMVATSLETYGYPVSPELEKIF
ncbi:MAG: formate acetyltransferase, partial [Cryobacterium sp.]|nr:formate acetyltransferase [Cryobacterium sp.]